VFVPFLKKEEPQWPIGVLRLFRAWEQMSQNGTLHVHKPDFQAISLLFSTKKSTLIKH
jgi:hypothetical protein